MVLFVVVLFPHPGFFFLMEMWFIFLVTQDVLEGGSLELLVLFFGSMYPFSEPPLFASAFVAVVLFAVMIFGGFLVVIHFVGPGRAFFLESSFRCHFLVVVSFFW